MFHSGGAKPLATAGRLSVKPAAPIPWLSISLAKLGLVEIPEYFPRRWPLLSPENMLSHPVPDFFGFSFTSLFQPTIYLSPVLPSLGRPLPPTVSVLEGGKGSAEETGFPLVIHPCQPPAAGNNHHLLRSAVSGEF